MEHLSRGQRLAMIAWHVVARALFVAAVLAVSLLPGVSLLASLLIVSGATCVVSAVNLLLTARGSDDLPPRPFTGDRFPRRPLPSGPSTSVERSLPNS